MSELFNTCNMTQYVTVKISSLNLKILTIRYYSVRIMEGGFLDVRIIDLE